MMKWISILLALATSLSAFGYKFDSDVPKEVQDQINNDLKFMGTIEGTNASKLHEDIFGEVDGKTYHKWFIDRVKAIGMDSCGDSIAVACVNMMEPDKMWLTDNYTKFDHPQIAKMMVVYHEARHTEVDHDNWPHATCPDPFLDSNGQDMKSIWTGAKLAGEPACDTTPYGSYGSSLILLKNIQEHCTNCTDKVKMDAGIYADDQLKRITDSGAHQEIVKDLYQTSFAVSR